VNKRERSENGRFNHPNNGKILINNSIDLVKFFDEGKKKMKQRNYEMRKQTKNQIKNQKHVFLDLVDLSYQSNQFTFH